jgi:transposase
MRAEPGLRPALFSTPRGRGWSGLEAFRGIEARIVRGAKEISEGLWRHRWVVGRTLAWLAPGCEVSLTVSDRPSTDAALRITHCRLPAGEGIFQARRSSLFSASSYPMKRKSGS